MVDLNCGYFTAPCNGVLTVDEDGWKFEKVCDFCDVPCDNPECFTKEE